VPGLRLYPRLHRRLHTLRQWVVLVFGAIGIGLLPWTVWLSSSLRPQHTTDNWDVAWAGFDSVLALMFLLTALAAWRRSPWVAVFAAITGTLLVTDAWFDVILESRADDLNAAIVEAVFAELPGAALCFWISYRTERFLAHVADSAIGKTAASHLTAAGKGAPEGDLVGVFEIPTDGKAAGEPRHPDPSA